MFTDIKRLRTFFAIAEEQSFTGAAERLNMAQPWVSVQLRQLEDNLNLRLVQRHKGKLLKLTPEGQKFYEIGQKLMDVSATVGREVKLLQQGTKDKIVLGVDPITLYMPDRNRLITRFIGEARKTELKVVSMAPSELFDGLAAGELDLILTSMPTSLSGVETLPMFNYDLNLAIPRSIADQYDPTLPGGLDGMQLLTLPDSHHPAIFAWLRKIFADEHIDWIECPENNYHALIRYAVLMGLPTFTPDFSSSIPEMQAEMVIKPIPNRQVNIQWALMRLSGYHRTATERFWEFAKILAQSGQG